MTREEFLSWDQKAEGGPKYEWRDGLVEVAGDWMKASERTIVANLLDRFVETAAWKSGGRLFAETECHLEAINATRIPDLAFFTLEQIRESQDGGNPVPGWVIEIVSPSERFFNVEFKVEEYFQSGVRVVWQIFPPVNRVRIFRSVEVVTNHSGDSPCSAAPVLPEYEISVEDIFRGR